MSAGEECEYECVCVLHLQELQNSVTKITEERDKAKQKFEHVYSQSKVSRSDAAIV